MPAATSRRDSVPITEAKNPLIALPASAPTMRPTPTIPKSRFACLVVKIRLPVSQNWLTRSSV